MQEKGIFGVIITAEKHLQISLDATYLLQIHVQFVAKISKLFLIKNRNGICGIRTI
jgi:hypothetical protein